jgi:imidazolonepropionase-like amidohydrolase
LLDGPKQPWQQKMALPLNNVEEAKEAAAMLAGAGVDFLKIYNNLSPAQFEAVVAVARERNIPFAGHIPFRLSLEQVSAAGQKSVEHADLSFVKDCIPDGQKAMPATLNAWIKSGFPGKYEESSRWWAKRDKAACMALYRRMAQRATFATPALSHEIKGGIWTSEEDLAILPADLRRACETSRASMDSAPHLRDAAAQEVLDLVREMHEAGVPLLAGSDTPNECLWHGRSLHKELRLLARAGLSNWEALKTATLNPARYLGRKDEGVIRKGAVANLLLLEADPLADITNTTKIGGVMLKGRWLGAAELAQMRGEKQPSATVYENGMLWNGSGFERRSLAVRDGIFIGRAEAGADAQRIDLGGAFVVPPYANAHAHLTDPTDKRSWSYLNSGVFYVWNPNTVVLGPQALDYFRRKDTFDVATSQGGVTEPGGHPEKLYVNVLSQFVYKGKTLKDFLGNAFHYGRSPAEIDAALDLLKTQGAGLVKTYLLYSEDYEKRRDDPEYYGFKGINPENFPYLIKAAHARGLPVITHVETVSDLKTAALGGADVAGHLPGYWAVKTEDDLRRRTLTPKDAALVAKSGMLLVPTYALAQADDNASPPAQGAERDLRAQVFAVQARNLQLLKKAGATFLMGTDTEGPLFKEAEHLVKIGGLSPLQVLQMVLSTGRHLFPQRRIGCFEAGCEADFLVLAADPRRDIAALRGIKMRVKAGRELKAPAGLDAN